MTVEGGPVAAPIAVPVAHRRTASRWLAALAVVLAVGWYVGVQRMMQDNLQRDEAALIDAASRVLNDQAQQAQRHAAVGAEVMAADSVLRMLLRSPPLDLETMRAQLSVLKKYFDADLLVLLAPGGRVLLALGDDSLAGADLSGDPLITDASTQDRAVSGLWGSRGRLIAVGARSVRFAEESSAIVVLGSIIDHRALEIAGGSVGTAGAIVLGSELIAAAPSDLKPALKTLVGREEAVLTPIAFDGRQFLGRVDRLAATALPVRVLWLRSIQTPPGMRWLSLLLLLPALAAAVAGVFSGLRRSPGQGAR